MVTVISLFNCLIIIPLGTCARQSHMDIMETVPVRTQRPDGRLSGGTVIPSFALIVLGLALALDTTPDHPSTFFAPWNEALSNVPYNLVYQYDSPDYRRRLYQDTHAHYLWK